MYCYKCGRQIEERAIKCVHCGVQTAHVMKPDYYKAGLLFGFIMILIPYVDFILGFFRQFIPYGIILFGLIGIVLAVISKRKAAIAVNIIGIILWILLIITPFFEIENINSQMSRGSQSVVVESGRVVTGDM